MRRGTTPTIIITAGCDLADMKSIYITLKQGNVELTKSTDELAVRGNKIHVFLSQIETLLFKKGAVQVQMRAVTRDGTAVASGIKTLQAGEILKEGVIT